MATVITAPEADRQLEAIDAWWRDNRASAPNVVPDVPFLRRLLMPASRYHVYYVTDGELVMILAVWSAVRGAGPDLGLITFTGVG